MRVLTLNQKINILDVCSVLVPLFLGVGIICVLFVGFTILIGDLSFIPTIIVGFIVIICSISTVGMKFFEKKAELKKYRKDNNLYTSAYQEFDDVLNENSISGGGGLGCRSYRICTNCEKTVLDVFTHYKTCTPYVHDKLNKLAEKF